jgi:hypothetical protein
MQHASLAAVDQRPRSIGERARAGAPWLPLALVLTMLVLSALGRSPVPTVFGAATDSDQLIVNGSVDREVHLDASGCVGAGALDLGTLVPDDPAASTAASCAIDFGSSNSAAGADLNVNEDPAAPDAATSSAMKCVGGGCSTVSPNPDEIPDHQGATMPGAGNDAFAMRVTGATLPATAVWTVNNYYDLQDAADLACQTTGLTDGTCNFRFAGMVSTTGTPPGSYQALAQYTVVPR